MKKFDWFLYGIFVAVGLATLFPWVGSHGGPLHPEITNKCGVALIFLLHGIGISFQALKAGTLHWRLHTLVQSCTFVLFPALGTAAYFGLAHWMTPELRLGLYFLCALPSTVSSSVAMTAAAHGNVPAALFNATISSLLGVVITPFWVELITARSGAGLGVGHVIADLCRWLVLPLIVGQSLRPVCGAWIHRNRKLVHVVDRLTILFLVYSSFCDSVVEGVWSSNSVGTLLLVLLLSALLFTAVMLISGGVARAMGFPVEDRIATMFCASKKSMATGVPMAQLMFGRTPLVGIVVLPLLIYHAFQLILAGILASRWAKRPDV